MTEERFKSVFGFSLLLILAGLAVVIGIGHVEEKTSYGLQIILGSITTLAGAYSQWAFGASSKERKDPQ